MASTAGKKRITGVGEKLGEKNSLGLKIFFFAI
jgi:hypothetical protein